MQNISRKSLKINIIPLIDIIFLMLVFFMLATNFSERREVEFSIDRKVNNQSSGSSTIFVFLKNNKYYIENKEFEKDFLESSILELWKSNNFKNIVILNDNKSEIETLIYALDLLKKNKIDQVTFANDIENQ
ncbi:MAG: hypothetical protein CMM95_01145 [Rickettsiales bacterium]|nr:hypothetical protein [Rickettsiales bacterium]|tara:strand:+ start:119 stop:514 length:396 start_codon:yes stop_codon:yes gene_type:complete